MMGLWIFGVSPFKVEQYIFKITLTVGDIMALSGYGKDVIPIKDIEITGGRIIGRYWGKRISQT